MTEFSTPPETENESFPVEPYYHPIHKITRRIYDFLASAKLAMFLLVVILASCLVGATVFSQERAGELIFNALWFNALLVLLVINVACCFFGRIWGRKITVISFGMILFHLSFVFMFLGIAYNSLFYFRGTIRLTEGETLPNTQKQSYDSGETGRFFNLAWLKGETTLVKLHNQYKVNGDNKRYAYEIAVGDARSRKQDVIYATKSLTHNGVGYYVDKEGYSLLVVLYDKQGRELYGAHIPLQSLKLTPDAENHFYTTGTKLGPSGFQFPQGNEAPLFDLQMQFIPDLKNDRGGMVAFKIKPFVSAADQQKALPLGEGTVPIGGRLSIGDYIVSPQEIRYWAGMNVIFEPGKPVVLTSLWFGFGGLIITFVGRLRRSSSLAASSSIRKS